MNVLLVNSDFSTLSDSRIMPLTMYSLGAVLREKGHAIKILDPLLYRSGYYPEDFADTLLGICDDFDVIAFSINSLSWAYAKISAKLLKSKGYKGYIVVGGVHATRAYASVLESADIDFAMLGEGDRSLPMLLDAIKNSKGYENVPGIAYKHGNRINTTKESHLIKLNEFVPLPAYDLVPPDAYKMFTFESSRGCYANCTFCSIIYKQCWRGFSPETAYERLKIATRVFQERTQIFKGKNICFTDDCFTADAKRAKELLTLMKDDYAEYMFLIEARLRHLLDDKLLEIIKAFPKISIQVGVESGYDKGLRKIKKGITVDDINQCAQVLCDHGITQNVFFSFIIGMPGESKEDILKTIRTVSNLRYQYGILCNCVWWLPFPSPELDSLKSMQSDFSEKIFDKIDWHLDNKLFYSIRPHLKKDEILEITELVNK